LLHVILFPSTLEELNQVVKLVKKKKVKRKQLATRKLTNNSLNSSSSAHTKENERG
jgi:hypothetical protein